MKEPYNYPAHLKDSLAVRKAAAFKTICQLAHVVPSFFAAEVPVQRFNDKDNDDVRIRFNLTFDDFPAFYIFKDSMPSIRYTDATQAPNMIRWLRSHGIMMPSIDSIDELDEVVDQFLKQPEQRYLETMRDLAKKYSTDFKASMYVKIMERSLEKGPGYAAEEIDRVMKILQGKVHPQKRSELADKLKVLKVFAKIEACDVYQCPSGYQKRFNAAGIIGADAATCCKPPCTSTDGSEHDSQGHHCDYYDERTVQECGDWDTGRFRANRMCCACGGGQVTRPQG
ncbi:unnamed protein product [Effrenium voratum]|uniref:Uncharacterized protein n=1 Tax=Effrenium voratum TaxID=2562239 RepID=A0AA36J452_9DINO|nr:unnamed protein product [Effrenium voratum]